MALIKCPECGKDISDKSKKCVNCGYPIKIINHKENLLKNWNKITIAVLVIFSAIGIFNFRYEILGQFGYHTIQLTDFKVIENNGIGKNLEYYMEIYNKRYYVGDVYKIIQAEDKMEIPITFYVVEKDEIDDIGLTTHVITSSDIRYSYDVMVTVKEKGGSKASAQFKLHYIVR